jgi:hypothetical protein
MTKVTMYQATDGSLHKTLKDKEAHNIKLRLKPAAEEFVSALTLDHFRRDDNGNHVVYADNLSDFIVNNADALRKILNDVLVVRRSRKAKKPATSQAAPASLS